jgi:hypothetical protein
LNQYNGKGETIVTISENLNHLSEGVHRVDIHGFSSGGAETDLTVNFTVDTIQPRVQCISVENKTYGANSIPLCLIVSKPATLEYCLDGQLNFTIFGNATLTGLSGGSHQLIVYAIDSAGLVGQTKLIQFAVNATANEPISTSKPSVTRSPFPSPTFEPKVEPTSTPKPASGFSGTNLLVEYDYAIVAVLVIIAITGLSLVYFKRFRRQKAIS